MIEINKKTPGLFGNIPYQINLKDGDEFNFSLKISGKRTPLNLISVDGSYEYRKQKAKEIKI